jgi:hypothetical protein
MLCKTTLGNEENHLQQILQYHEENFNSYLVFGWLCWPDAQTITMADKCLVSIDIVQCKWIFSRFIGQRFTSQHDRVQLKHLLYTLTMINCYDQ